MSGKIDVRAGSVYLPAEVAEVYFRGVDAVALLIRDGVLQILPVRQTASGGCLLKIRNAAGDRVASAPALFEANGLRDWQATDLTARWSSDHAGLLIALTDN